MSFVVNDVRLNSGRGKQRGVSSVIGGIFVLAIIVLGVTSIIYVSNLQNTANQAQNSAAQLDAMKNQERLSLVSAGFGGSETYSAGQSYVTGTGANAGDGCVSGSTQVCGITMTEGSGFRYGSSSWCAVRSVCGNGNAKGGSYTLGTIEPGFTPFNVTSTSTSAPNSGSQEAISNMNMTNSAAGWTFYTTSSQVIGGFDPIEGNGVPGSGVGSLFIGAAYLRNAIVDGNLSTRFFVNPSSTGVGTITNSILTFAYFMPAANVAGACIVSSGGVVFNIYLVDESTGYPNSGRNYLITSITDSGDQNWNYIYGNAALNTLANGSPLSSVFVDKGYYALIIQTIIQFSSSKSCANSAPRFYGYYDDIGLSYSYTSLSSDWYYTFAVSQSPVSVKTLSFSVTSFYNVSDVLQSVYLYDWVLNSWDLFSTSTVSTTPSTVSLTINVTNTGQFSAQNLVSSSGHVELRVYSVRPTTGLPLGTHEMETDITSIGQSGASGFSVGISFTSNSAFTVSVYNAGPQPINIVELGIIDSQGHSYINASGITFYNGTFSKQITYGPTIDPLQTITTQIGYSWTSGTMTLVFVTSLGNVFIFNEKAG